MQIAVLGGGNGSMAAAADMALAGHRVKLWRRNAAAVQAHNAPNRAVVVKDFRGQHHARLAVVATPRPRFSRSH